MSRQDQELQRYHEKHNHNGSKEEYGHHHDHHHEQEEKCGHVHHHEHKHGEECGCGHGHHHDHVHQHGDIPQEIHEMPAGIAQKVYILENLGCANCAAKMERKINELPEVEAASITFATKKLVVASDRQESILPVLQRICASIESEVIVLPQEVKVMEKKENQSFFAANKADILGISSGAVLFAAGIAAKNMELSPFINHIMFFFSNLILGLDIIWKAL